MLTNGMSLRAMELAKTQWISIRSDQINRCYEAILAGADLPEPVWPDKSLPELLRLAYARKIIDRADHPKIQDLQGLV